MTLSTHAPNPPTSPSTGPLLEASGLVVSFGGVRALDELDLAVEAGEIHGVIGPNGAGKTTAINALTGFVPLAGGRVSFDGDPLPRGTHRIAALGIGRTFQAPATFPALTVEENVLTGAHRRLRTGIPGAILQPSRTRREEAEARREAAELLARVGFELPPRTPVADLPYGEHRKVEIARALMFRPRLLLLDEPTAGLTAEEVAAIGGVLRAAVDEAGHGLSVILVEHNVPFVFGLCDRVTAFHQGRAIARGTPEEVRADESVVASYLGGEVGETDAARVGPVGAPPAAVKYPVEVHEPSDSSASTRTREISLEVSGLHAGYGKVSVLRGVDLHVGEGELVMVYGRNGAGKSTLLNAIAGQPRPSRGTVSLYGTQLQRRSVSSIVRSGLALVPQERGVIAGQSVDDNLRLGLVGVRLSRAQLRERRDEVLERFPALQSRTGQLAGTLSGGERQMLALAKVLVRRPRVLLLDEPSIGLAPTIVDELADIVAGIRADDVSVLVAEQNVSWVAPLATRAYLLETGHIASSGSVDDVLARESLAATYLGDEPTPIGDHDSGPPSPPSPT